MQPSAGHACISAEGHKHAAVRCHLGFQYPDGFLPLIRHFGSIESEEFHRLGAVHLTSKCSSLIQHPSCALAVDAKVKLIDIATSGTNACS
ncbi:tex-like protein [Anopheles sinensis]|uniref:Tex-like protein n=1 Tax=Anopheles sinensis TaxID=74873 RepID=A0A084W1C8_ANOSI|nr:tex-like protein [Anopheles sinensis]